MPSRKGRYLFTSESVTEGHPDKICDQISDAIVDACIREDRYSRVACNTMVKGNNVFIVGEITTGSGIDIDDYVTEIARETIREIGYTDPSLGFDYETCKITTHITKQSPDIAVGVTATENREQGAGDQGMMFGYACNQTPELMPLPIMLAHGLTRKLAEARKSGRLGWLRPDGKSQVVVEYSDGTPLNVKQVTIAAHHSPKVKNDEINEGIMREVIMPVISPFLRDGETKYVINGTGRFEIGGPVADSGLTGRKIIIDTYGGYGGHGGGAFSGKDPSKVDRSAAYMARYIAKQIVSAGLASECGLMVSYTIGKADPDSVTVWTFGTGRVPEEELESYIKDTFPIKPGEIIKHLGLLRPIYSKTACYGHFGREDEDFTWERTDKADEMRHWAADRAAKMRLQYA